MPDYYSVDQGRAYIHKTCGTITIVSGRDFAGLCNPFSPCLGTICAKCGPDSTKKFAWEDTGESVSRFRRRVRRATPVWTLWNWIIAPVIAPVIGAAVGALVMLAFKARNFDSTVAAAIGATIGSVAMALFIAPYVTGIAAGRRFYDRR